MGKYSTPITEKSDERIASEIKLCEAALAGETTFTWSNAKPESYARWLKRLISERDARLTRGQTVVFS